MAYYLEIALGLRDGVKDYLTPQQTKDLIVAVKPTEALGGREYEEKFFIRCDLTCQSEQRDETLNFGAPLDIRRAAPEAFAALGVEVAGQSNCTNRAALVPNHITDRNEPSYCREPNNYPYPDMHADWNNRNPCVCLDCKRNRGNIFKWRLEGVWHGVCEPCRKWASNNMRIGENRCVCEPVGKAALQAASQPTNAGPELPYVPQGEQASYHMCRAHGLAYWQKVWRNAGPETERRSRLVRKTTRRGNNWTRKKNAAAERAALRAAMTDEQWEAHKAGTPFKRRYQGTRLRPAREAEIDPRCFCGSPLDVWGQIKGSLPTFPDGSDGPGPIRKQDKVRNCAGCNGFIRRC